VVGSIARQLDAPSMISNWLAPDDGLFSIPCSSRLPSLAAYEFIPCRQRVNQPTDEFVLSDATLHPLVWKFVAVLRWHRLNAEFLAWAGKFGSIESERACHAFPRVASAL
jgi:hypothetical protein